DDETETRNERLEEAPAKPWAELGGIVITGPGPGPLVGCGALDPAFRPPDAGRRGRHQAAIPGEIVQNGAPTLHEPTPENYARATCDGREKEFGASPDDPKPSDPPSRIEEQREYMGEETTPEQDQHGHRRRVRPAGHSGYCHRGPSLAPRAKALRWTE